MSSIDELARGLCKAIGVPPGSLGPQPGPGPVEKIKKHRKPGGRRINKSDGWQSPAQVIASGDAHPMRDLVNQLPKPSGANTTKRAAPTMPAVVDVDDGVGLVEVPEAKAAKPKRGNNKKNPKRAVVEPQRGLVGRVKFYKKEQGYGFITPVNPIPGYNCDVFVHASGLAGGLESLKSEELVFFDLVPGRDGRMQAVNVSLADG